MKRRQSIRRKRARQERKQSKPVSETTNQAPTPCAGNDPVTIEKEQPRKESAILANVIILVGFIPMVMLVAILATHEYYIDRIPWFKPIVEKQVAVLTLTAGQAAIVGLFMDKRLYEWSSVALLIAATATYTAGYQIIGDNTAEQVIAIVLFFSGILIVFAKRISAGMNKTWCFVRSKKGLVTILVIVGAMATIYNQSRDENYIRNWILIPSAVFVGFVVSIGVLWLLIKLSIKCLATVYPWLRQRISYAYNRLKSIPQKPNKRTGK